MERIPFADARGVPRQTQHHLRERKDEKTSEEGGQNRRFGTDPGAERRGHEPDYGRDELSPKAADVDGTHFALSILDFHSNLQRVVASRPATLPCGASSNLKLANDGIKAYSRL